MKEHTGNVAGAFPAGRSFFFPEFALRNLLQHPITLHEIEECLNSLAVQLLKEESIGDMRPLLLITAAKMLRRLDFAMSEVRVIPVEQR